MADFYIKVGDRLPAITGQLLDGNGDPVALGTAGVSFAMRRLDDDVMLIDAPAVVDDAALGKVSFPWRAGDTATPGTYLAEWRVAFASGEQTFPNDRQLVIEVMVDVPTFPTLDAPDLAWLRQWLGGNPTDGELAAAVALHGGRTSAALAILRQRRADILGQPISLTIPGDLSVNYGENVKALDAAVQQLEALDAAEGDNGAGGGGLAGAYFVREGGGWGR